MKVVHFVLSDSFAGIEQHVDELLVNHLTDNPILICNEENRFITAEQLREIGVIPDSIILETLARGTAPAIAIAAFKAIEAGYDHYILVLSFKNAIS